MLFSQSVISSLLGRRSNRNSQTSDRQTHSRKLCAVCTHPITTKNLGKNDKNAFGPLGNAVLEWCSKQGIFDTANSMVYFTEKPTHPQIGIRNRTPEKESNKSRQNKRRTNWNSIGQFQFRHLGSGSRSLPFPMGGKRVGGS